MNTYGPRSVRRAASAGAWCATPWAVRPYVPLVLGNGSDSVTVDYSGSMLCSLDGHAHKEQHQAVVPGWYKQIHRLYRIPPRVARTVAFPSRSGMPLPCLQAGYAVRINGEYVSPSDYRQTFDARRAVVTTDLVFQGGRWRVTGYLTGDHVWVERFRVVSMPRGQRVDLLFQLLPWTDSMHMGLEPSRRAFLSVAPAGPGALALEYRMDPNPRRGAGLLWTAPRGRFEGRSIVHAGVRAGFTVVRWLLAVDAGERPPCAGGPRAWYRKLRTRPEPAWRRAHVADWLAFSGHSAVRLPDAEAGGAYDLSLYWLRANQHPETGSLNLGPFPCHWGGGSNALWDAGVMQMALLGGNHVAESRRLLDFYRRRLPAARRLARALGAPGARLCFFASAAAGQEQHADPDRVRREKIAANATACHSVYDHWRIHGRDDALAEDLALMRDLLDHVAAVAVIERDDRAWIVDAAGVAEGRCPVSNDSFLALHVARAFRGFCEMADAAGRPAPDRFRALSAKLVRGLRDNVRRGLLMADRRAVQGVASPLLALSDLPDALAGLYTPATLRAWRRQTRTPWGYDKPKKDYRDWPWCHCWLAIVYSHWGRSRAAFAELRRALKDASALGALPEKVRLDGFPVRYWYTTAHAAYAHAVQHALAHDRPGGAVGLLQGLDGLWRDLAVRRLRLCGGLLVSLDVRAGAVRRAVVENNGVRPLRRALIWNPRYTGVRAAAVDLEPGRKIVWTERLP